MDKRKMTTSELEKKPNSNIVVGLAIQSHSAPIAVLQILHLLSLLVPFVRTRLPCGVRLALVQLQLKPSIPIKSDDSYTRKSENATFS